MLKADFTLNTLLTAMRNAGCGDPHPIFAGGLRYIPPSAKNTTDREAFEELSQYGFTQGNGVTPEFEDVLRLIDNPSHEFFAYARDTEGQIGILVAAQNRTAVSVVCRGERVELNGVSPDTHPADALVRLLPPCGPAASSPFRFRRKTSNRRRKATSSTTRPPAAGKPKNSTPSSSSRTSASDSFTPRTRQNTSSPQLPGPRSRPRRHPARGRLHQRPAGRTPGNSAAN